MKYVIYQRVSTDDQCINTQKNECLNYIKTKHPGESFKYSVYSDPDTSSKIKMSKRKGLQEFLNSLKSGHNVIVYKLDRLSRDIIEMVTIYRMIKEKGCTLYSLNDPDCDNEFIIGLMGVLAQKERKDISDRTKAHLRAKKEKNEKIGTIPYGYTVCPDNLIRFKNSDNQIAYRPGNLIPLNSEQEVLDIMSQLFDQGLSYRGIAKALTCQGHKNRKGNPFQPTSIFRILVRIGKARFRGQSQSETEFETFHLESL
jgi:DNA invertase Pin-like site-specific DNA recombinase